MLAMKGHLLRLVLAVFAAALLAMPAAAQNADRYAFTQDYEPAPALWKLADEDTTIYMMGTIHVLPPGFAWRSPQLDDIITQAEELVVETSDYDIERNLVAFDGKLAHRIATRSPTSRNLSLPARARWRSLIRHSGLDYATMDTMPVLLALLTMGMYGDAGNPASPLFGVETVLEQEFVDSGRPVISLEDSGAVMYSLFRQEDPELLADLEAKLTGWNGKDPGSFYEVGYVPATGDAFWAAEHAWARGEVAEDFSLGFGNGPIGLAFDRNLLDRRNRAWAAWLDARLDEPGTILVAVGAGHFEGADSVLAKLLAHGLEAERIN